VGIVAIDRGARNGRAHRPRAARGQAGDRRRGRLRRGPQVDTAGQGSTPPQARVTASPSPLVQGACGTPATSAPTPPGRGWSSRTMGGTALGSSGSTWCGTPHAPRGLCSRSSNSPTRTLHWRGERWSTDPSSLTKATSTNDAACSLRQRCAGATLCLDRFSLSTTPHGDARARGRGPASAAPSSPPRGSRGVLPGRACGAAGRGSRGRRRRCRECA